MQMSDPVGIIGIGGLGTLAVQFAKALGHPVLALDNRQEGRDLATEFELKADIVLDPNDAGAIDKIKAWSGRDGLAEQARTALVRRIDDEGSLRFRVEGEPVAVARRVPVEGRYRDGDELSGPAVNLLLHVVGGRLHELAVFKDDGAHIRVSPFEVSPYRIAVSAN